MRLTKCLRMTLVAAAVGALNAHAEISAELLDLAGRVHYGYYHGEVATIAAAQTALERLGESPAVVYYRDFAALRRAQLGTNDRANVKQLRECAQRDAAAQRGAAAAEAWVLVAACALLADDGRRVEQALARARNYDDDNPRIALIEAWRVQGAANRNPVERAGLADKLAATVEAFDAWTAPLDDPDWGYAEALTALGSDALERGELRAARDLIERALLIAPDFRVALELEAAMQSSRASRSP